MNGNKLEKAIALGLSTVLVSMSCLNASAIDYKKVLNKKNISIAALGSAVILGSYFLYNHFKAPGAEKSQDEEQLVGINDHQVEKSEKNKEEIAEEEEKTTENEEKDQINEESNENDEKNLQMELKECLKEEHVEPASMEERTDKLTIDGRKFDIFDTSNINELGKKVYIYKTARVNSPRIQDISENDKNNIIEAEDIIDIRMVETGENEADPVLIFHNGEKVKEKDLNLNEHFRQDKKGDGMVYFKSKDKLYKLGQYRCDYQNKVVGDLFFVDVDGRIWDRKDLNNLRSEKENKIYQKDSWRALLFAKGVWQIRTKS